MTINFSQQPAYILHTRAYRDTSLLLDVYTRDFGRVTVIAKGVKRAKRSSAGLLQPFMPLSFSAKGRGDILTMTGVEPLAMPLQLIGQRQIVGLYVNEIMVRLVGKFESAVALFDNYQNTLVDLQEKNIEIVLRRFERRLIEELGYGLSFGITLPDSQPIVAEKKYIFVLNQGFVEVANQSIPNQREQSGSLFSGKILLKIAQDDYSCEESLFTAKQLFRHVIQFYLGKKPLLSRQLWLSEV